MAKQKSKKVRVHILTPVEGGRDSCDLPRALRYVKQGRARVIDPGDPECNVIEFVAQDYRHLAAQETIGGRNQAPKTSATPLPVCGNLACYNDKESMRTFGRYPED